MTNPEITQRDPLARVARIREWMATAGVDAFYLRTTTNIAWATGFSGVFDEEKAHALLVLPDVVVLHTDSRYDAACRQAAQGTGIVVDARPRAHFAVLLSLLEDMRAGSLAIALEDTVTVREHEDVCKLAEDFATPVSLRVTREVVEGLRAVKDAEEVGRMHKAQAITDAGFAHIVGFMRPGMTEREVQLELDRFMLDSGADGLAFPTIVATGAHGASPHAQPGPTQLREGDAVVMDFGARYQGYCSDMTRTVFVGEPDEELRRAWETLRQANEECEALLRAGVTGSAVHQHAEEVLAQAGYAGKMGHSLGHSLGLDIHEAPNLSPRNDQPLPEGTVCTVEPGIYLEGRFGMRLEDFGVVRADGYEVLTKSTHDMVIIDVHD